MTTHMPGITIPAAVLQHPAASVLLPIALGTAVGFGTRRETHPHPVLSAMILDKLTWDTRAAYSAAAETQKTYLALRQPPLYPPPWVFGPVWTLLYGLMGYASYRVANIGLSPLASPGTFDVTKQSMSLYTIQLCLNLAWMPLFFVAKRPVEATADIVTLLGLNGYLAYLWGTVDGVAGLYHLPYLGWLSFATYLCVSAGHLNGWDFSDKEIDKTGKTK